MEIPIEVDSPLHRAFKDTLGGLTLNLLASQVISSSESSFHADNLSAKPRDLIAEWLRQFQFSRKTLRKDITILDQVVMSQDNF